MLLRGVYHSRCLKLQKLGVKILQNFFRNFLPFTHYACFIECLHALIFRNAPCFLYVISINMNSNWSGKVEFSLDLKRDITSNCSKNQHLTFWCWKTLEYCCSRSKKYKNHNQTSQFEKKDFTALKDFVDFVFLHYLLK